MASKDPTLRLAKVAIDEIVMQGVAVGEGHRDGRVTTKVDDSLMDHMPTMTAQSIDIAPCIVVVDGSAIATANIQMMAIPMRDPFNLAAGVMVNFQMFAGGAGYIGTMLIDEFEKLVVSLQHALALAKLEAEAETDRG